MSARAGPDSLSVLSAAIRAVAEEGDAPELLIGVLLEGAVYAAQRLSPDRHKEVALAMTRLLADRLDAVGLYTSGKTDGQVSPD